MALRGDHDHALAGEPLAGEPFEPPRTSSGSDGEPRTSKRSCTAVESLLTFCPPGPDERMKLLVDFVVVDG